MAENLDILNTAVSLIIPGRSRSAGRQRLSASCPPPLCSVFPAPKYCVMIPKPRVLQGKRPPERLRDPCSSSFRPGGESPIPHLVFCPRVHVVHVNLAAGRTGTVRINCRQVLNTNRRGPSGSITFSSRSRSSSHPLCRLPECLGAGVQYTPSLAIRSTVPAPCRGTKPRNSHYPKSDCDSSAKQPATTARGPPGRHRERSSSVSKPTPAAPSLVTNHKKVFVLLT
jgi:hypothetical protein